MFNDINNIFYRYDYNRDYKLTLVDLQKNGKTAEQFRQEVEELTSVEKNYLYTFVIDQSLRHSLNIQDVPDLYKTNDQELEEIKLRWPRSGEKIIISALDYSLRPAVVASIFEAELLFKPGLDNQLDQELIRQKVSIFKNTFLKNNKNDYLWALAEYQLSFGSRKSANVLTEWKTKYLNYDNNNIKKKYHNYGDNIRLSEDDDVGAIADDLSDRQRAAGIISAAYVQQESPTYNFIQKFIDSLHHYTQRPGKFNFFPQWLVAKLQNSELNSFFVSKFYPWNWAGLLNSNPEPSAVKPLQGIYFQIYKKLAYLGLADSGMNNFKNANLVDVLKYSGYVNMSCINFNTDNILNIDDLWAYRHDGNLSHIFPEENAKKLLTVLDSYIERINASQNVISNISAINTMVFRTEYESNFLDIINDACRKLKMQPQELIEIYYKDKKLINWKMPESVGHKNYLYVLAVIIEEYIHVRNPLFADTQVVISPQFREYLKNKYKLTIDDYDKNTQEKFIKEFFRRVKSGTNGQGIDYNDFVDGFFGEINYKKMDNFLNDFMLFAPSFGRPSYYVTSGYKMRIDPVLGILAKHTGVDLQGNLGDPIYAVSGGEVISTEISGNYGGTIIVRQADQTEIYYGHCDNIIKNRGNKVSVGEQIATIGSSGKSTGYHVHIEYRKNGKSVPPLNFDKSVWEALTEFYNDNRQKYQ